MSARALQLQHNYAPNTCLACGKFVSENEADCITHLFFVHQITTLAEPVSLIKRHEGIKLAIQKIEAELKQLQESDQVRFVIESCMRIYFSPQVRADSSQASSSQSQSQ